MDGYKPYWAVLHNGYLTLYYDPTLKERKEAYQLKDLNDITKLTKSRMSFVYGYLTIV